MWLLFYAWDVKAKHTLENILSFFLCTETHHSLLFTDGEMGCGGGGADIKVMGEPGPAATLSGRKALSLLGQESF